MTLPDGKLVEKFNLEPAQEFGEIVELLSPTARPFGAGQEANYSPTGIVSELEYKLFNFCDDDHLLLIGNPALIGMATSIAMFVNFGRAKLLQWDRFTKRYILINVRLNCKPN